MYEFIIKDKPILVKNNMMIVMDKIPSTKFKDKTDLLIKVFEKFSKKENQSFGHNDIDKDIILISDPNDKIFDVLYQKFNDTKKRTEKNFFIHTSFYSIPSLTQMNFYIKSIKIFELDDKILINGEFLENPYLFPQTLLNILEVCDFLIHKFFHKDKLPIIEIDDTVENSSDKQLKQQKILKFNNTMEDIFNFTN